MNGFQLQVQETAADPWDSDRDVALTPRGVVRQGLAWLLAEFRMPHTPRVLDPSAGSGVFGAEARLALPGAYLAGVEPAPHPWDWARHYESATAGRFQDLNDHIGYDLVCGNPPFSHLCDFIQHGLRHLRPKGVMAYLGLLDWGQRGRDHENVWREHTPVMQARIPGSVAMRGDGRGDARSYCWWVWMRDRSVDWTVMVTLPRLPSESRRWREVPGQEQDRA